MSHAPRLRVPGRLYRGLGRILEPVAPLVVRLRESGVPAGHRRERLGTTAPPGPVTVWWHAASLGEVAALHPILDAARETGIGEGFRVTTTTVAGRRAAAARWGDAVTLAPLDLPRIQRRHWQRWDPVSWILVETELWPNALFEAHRRRTRVGVVNARISDRSWPRYRRWESVFRPLLERVQAVAAQTDRDAARFAGLGVPPDVIRVTGNAKHDRILPADPARHPWSPPVRIWTAGCLHPGEEEAVVEAYDRLRDRVPELRLVLVPRHPHRWDGPPRGLAARGLRAAHRSRPRPDDGDCPVLWVDTEGELASFYAAAEVAFVGGTLVPVGGHNLFEAASFAPVAHGPHVANTREEAGALGSGGRRVETADDLVAVLGDWLGDRDRGERARREARAAVVSAAGAARRSVDWLRERGVLGNRDHA